MGIQIRFGVCPEELIFVPLVQRNSYKHLPWLAVCGLIYLALAACVPVEKAEFTGIHVDLADPGTRLILDFQDRQQQDSLLEYFQHPDPTYRFLAAKAFASIRDSQAIPGLAAMLEDPVDAVRAAAAYALGQSRSQQAESFLLAGFRQYDSLSVNTLSNSTILEAIGKCGRHSSLKALATVRTYTKMDTALLVGQIRGIYRFALRGLTAPEGTATAVRYLVEGGYPGPVRLIAVNYLFRAEGLDYNPFINRLIVTFESDPEPAIRMCLAVALGKSGGGQALESLRRQFSVETDYRVLCNMLRGLSYFDYARVKDIVFAALQHKNPHVRRTAAQFFIDQGNSLDAQQYRTISRSLPQSLTKALMYAATNKHLPDYFSITKGNLNQEIEAYYDQIDDPVLKGYYLKAMASDPANYERVMTMGFKSDVLPVRTMAIEAIAQIAVDPLMEKKFGQRGARRVRQEIFQGFTEAIQSGDAAMVAVAAQTITDPAAGLLEMAREQPAIFENALSELDLPAEIETDHALRQCLASIRGEEYLIQPPAWNHPIAWDVLEGLADTLLAECITGKGLIRLELYPSHAPGTVANFVRLSRDKFYNGKTFHRVVPNFVIQGGCPRGDGYGSLDYTIRSELGPLYYDDAGYLGMASAGNHTEGTQWFITHSPTPHLDGNYSIFGKVTAGMEVVHAIQPGDVIKEIHVIN